MSENKILVIDDEKEINDIVCSYLVKQNFSTRSAYNGADGLQALEKYQPDLILLDVMLPDINGVDLCLKIRKKTDVPVLFLSCKSEEIDKIVALSVGGDDYITKPFSPGELVARIKANLRRAPASTYNQDLREELYELPGLAINMTTREVYSSGEPVFLTAKEFDVLSLFVRNPKRIFSASQIFELIWHTDSIEGDKNTVMVYVSNIRKKIESNPANPKYILSIRGVGYKFNHQLLK